LGHLRRPLDRPPLHVRTVGCDEDPLYQDATALVPFAGRDYIPGVVEKQPIRYEQERHYPLSVAEAWRLLADTDHLNRAIGLPAVEFSPLAGAADPLVRHARAKAYGVVPVSWREFPFD